MWKGFLWMIHMDRDEFANDIFVGYVITKLIWAIEQLIKKVPK